MKFILLFILSIHLASCKKTVNIPEKENFSSDIDYFGLKKGNFIEYLVTHIVHDDEVDIHDTLQFKFKTSIGSNLSSNISLL